MARLQGDPAQPFSRRWVLTTCTSCVVDLVALVTLLAAWALFARRIHIPPSGHAWMAAQCGHIAVQVVMCRRGASPGWRELGAATFRLNSFGLGAANAITKLWLDQTACQTGRLALARHALLMLFSSGAGTLLLVQGKPMRLSLALAVQLFVVLKCMQFNVTTCSGAALSDALAQQQTQDLFDFLELASFSPIPVSAKIQPAAQCSAVLSYFQLSVGLVLPLLVQAALESFLFQEHQQQRRQRGMPPEGGCMQQLYDAFSSLAGELDRATLIVMLWLLLGLLWKVAVAIAFAQTGGSEAL